MAAGDGRVAEVANVDEEGVKMEDNPIYDIAGDDKDGSYQVSYKKRKPSDVFAFPGSTVPAFWESPPASTVAFPPPW